MDQLTTEHCPKCARPMEQVKIAYFTEMTPVSTFKCRLCNITWAKVAVQGRTPMILNITDRPRSQPFSEWVSEQIRKKTSN